MIRSCDTQIVVTGVMIPPMIMMNEEKKYEKTKKTE